jgi:hypothetical protein
VCAVSLACPVLRRFYLYAAPSHLGCIISGRGRYRPMSGAYPEQGEEEVIVADERLQQRLSRRQAAAKLPVRAVLTNPQELSGHHFD